MYFTLFQKFPSLFYVNLLTGRQKKWQARAVRLRFSSSFLVFDSVLSSSQYQQSLRLFSSSPCSSSGPYSSSLTRSDSFSSPKILPQIKQWCLMCDMLFARDFTVLNKPQRESWQNIPLAVIREIGLNQMQINADRALGAYATFLPFINQT